MSVRRVVVITGGNRGIGLGIAKRYLEGGWMVVVGCRDPECFPKQIKTNDLAIFKIDVRIEETLVALANFALNKFGRIDAWINNAGFSKWSPIEEIDNSFLTEIFETNLFGAFWGCKVAASKLVSGGVIINVSSIAGKRGSANNSAYASTKFAMNGLTQSLAKELGKRGIRVNGICPVLVETLGLTEALAQRNAPAEGQDVFRYLKTFCETNAALNFLPSVENVGDMAVFLSSEKASAITGQNINVDCGVFPQ
jgi:NAD(P)-dependent dehydrogenase (short-subunit alcohol dehydrogenase family)